MWHIYIASKIPNIIIYSWYAHIWHEIHIFQLAIKCAWWVISKCAHIIRHETMYVFQSVQSDILCLFYMKRWICTIKKVSPLHLFSMKFALTFQRTLHLFHCWNLHVFFDEIRASFCRDEICVSFFVEFFTCFLMKFSFVGFKKFRFLAITLKNMWDMGMNPSVKMERIELSIQLWGLYGASTRSDQGILI